MFALILAQGVIWPSPPFVRTDQYTARAELGAIVSLCSWARMMGALSQRPFELRS